MKIGKAVLIVVAVLLGIYTFIHFLSFANDRKDNYSAKTDYSSIISNTLIFSDKGNGDKNTDRFYLNGNRCRIEYSFKGNFRNKGLLMVHLYKDGEDADTELGSPLIMQTESVDNVVSYFYKPAGKYYLEIKCGGKYALQIIQE